MNDQQRVTTSASRAPSYFHSIRHQAEKRWDQLEADPELAGPWHQLFKQVQSPRHVLSELLQNADDAGATAASVSIENHRFVFEHNGEDFTEAHFASLCRFGYSNKRALHTIGFRGIGFKSTFSLGDQVRLFTPTLSVAFERRRFTEPFWVDHSPQTQGLTRIEVDVENDRLVNDIQKNLTEWLKSPASLLFFKAIRSLQIGGQLVQWRSLGPGPAPNSEWMTLEGGSDEVFLHVQSEEEEFPEDALDEIRKERMLGIDDAGVFPPSRVELVLGVKGRLYVVLPTGVETPLPYACNAPFIQDPARLKIKDPWTSPTNRWLLSRLGKLAANTMVSWLGRVDLGVKQRSAAYQLLPAPERDGGTLEGVCADTVEIAFAEVIQDKRIILTENENLVLAKEAVALPSQLLEIWTASEIQPLLGTSISAVLCRHLNHDSREKLISWKLVGEFSRRELIDRLRVVRMPRPQRWVQLLEFWRHIAPDVTSWKFRRADELCIMPVQGREDLYPATEVVRLGERRLLKSDEDWGFLSGYVLVLHPYWTRFLSDQRRESDQEDITEAAFAVLKKVGMEDASDVSTLIDRVSCTFFSARKLPLADCVRLAQIAAALGATPGASFRFVCRDLKLRSTKEKALLLDETGELDELLPEPVLQSQCLHSDYLSGFQSCSRDEWLRWITSERSGAHTFPPLSSRSTAINGRKKLMAQARLRGAAGELVFPYVRDKFILEDWDFPQSFWSHWERISELDQSVWARVMGRILGQRDSYWTKPSNARLVQVTTNGTRRPVTSETLLPDWILKFREKPCLLDTRGEPRMPSELLLRTAETESMIDVEPFVQGRLDRESTRVLLSLLGVGSQPPGPNRLLNRIRALAQAQNAPIYEVEKWYRRLDRLLETASTADSSLVSDAFLQESLIFAADGTWARSNAVYLMDNQDEVPGASVIRASVRHLMLWRRIGVAERPSVDLALDWMRTLKADETLPTEYGRRIKALTARYPQRVWEDVGSWLNLAGEWVECQSLAYSLSMQGLFSYSHFHDWVKRKTADLRHLPSEIVKTAPFSSLRPLTDVVAEKLSEPSFAKRSDADIPWLRYFGKQLARMQLSDVSEANRIRGLAQEIENTRLVPIERLEVVPYIDGIPAGTARLADILWLDCKLFTSPISKAKLAKRIPEEIGRSLGADLRAALAYSFERAPNDIRAYLEQNFTLAAEDFNVPIRLSIVPGAGIEQSVDDSSPSAESEVMEQGAKAVDEPDQMGDSPGPQYCEAELPAQERPDESVQLDQDQDASAKEVSHTPIDAADEKPLRKTTKSFRPSLIERYAIAKGLRSLTTKEFVGHDGQWIRPSNGMRFPWATGMSNEENIRFLFPIEHCLEEDPLEIEAEVWALLEQKPEIYSLVLVDADGQPVEVPGTQLREFRRIGKIVLHPATYRVVLSSEVS